MLQPGYAFSHIGNSAWVAIGVYLVMQSVYRDQLKRFQVGEDSPVFPGLFSYCQVRASGGGKEFIL